MKRILSLLLMLSMLLAMGSFSVAADTVGTTLTLFDGSFLKYSFGTVHTDGTILTGGDNFYPVTTSTYKPQMIVRSGDFYGTGVTKAVENDDEYYAVNWSDIQNNYRTTLTEYLTDNPVISVSYDIRIPQVSSDKWRKTAIRYSSNASSGVTNSAYIYVEYDDSIFSVTTSDITELSSKTKSYTPGSWITVEARAYRTEEGVMMVGVYVGGEQIYYGQGTGNYVDGLGVRQLNFTTETTEVTNDDSATSIITYDNHMDDIKVSVLPATYIPVDGIVSEKNLTIFDGSLYNSAGKDVGASITSGSFYPTPDSAIRSTQQLNLRGKDYACGTNVSSATEGDNNYYVINWSDVQSNYRTDLTEHMTNNPVVSVSYDMRIPSANSDKWRKTEVRFSSNPAAGTDNLSNVIIDYDDSTFSASATNTNAVTSKIKSYAPGSWVNVEVRAYLTSAKKLEIGVYVGGEQIYYGESIGDYSAGFGLRQINLKTEETASDHTGTTYDTHYDDIDVSVLLADSIPEPMIKISLNETSSGVESKATVLSNYNNLCLITAVFNGSGALEKVWVDTTLENGVLSSAITDAQYLKSGYEVKAFVFDTLQSAIPQVKSESITLTSN